MTKLESYLQSWALSNPERIASTPTSDVYRVSQADGHDAPIAVLKVFTQIGHKDESAGSIALEYFDGDGAVGLLRHDAGAQLLEFAPGTSLAAHTVSLEEIEPRNEAGSHRDATALRDDQAATRIVCELLDRLHRRRGPMPGGLVPLERRFQALFEFAECSVGQSGRDETTGSKPVAAVPLPLVREAAVVARKLLASPRNEVVLHGDVHHGNVIGRDREWRLVDPKGLRGESTFDFANLFYNPAERPDVVEDPQRIAQMAAAIADHVAVPRKRLLEFAFAYGILSALWSVEDGHDPSLAIRVASLIQAQL